jgi:hypothetical protein
MNRAVWINYTNTQCDHEETTGSAIKRKQIEIPGFD